MSDVLPAPARPPTLLAEAAAALATVVGCVLLGAPVGLAWAALAPRIDATVSGGRVQVANASTSDFIASDAWFVGLCAGAGLVTALVALAVGRRHALGCALGLALGGLLAAEVARRSGTIVGAQDLRAALEGGDGSLEVMARLRATSALVAWPLAALVVHMAGTAASAPPADS